VQDGCLSKGDVKDKGERTCRSIVAEKGWQSGQGGELKRRAERNWRRGKEKAGTSTGGAGPFDGHGRERQDKRRQRDERSVGPYKSSRKRQKREKRTTKKTSTLKGPWKEIDRIGQ